MLDRKQKTRPRKTSPDDPPNCRAMACEIDPITGILVLPEIRISQKLRWHRALEKAAHVLLRDEWAALDRWRSRSIPAALALQGTYQELAGIFQGSNLVLKNSRFGLNT
jgi:hypothetical protein